MKVNQGPGFKQFEAILNKQPVGPAEKKTGTGEGDKVAFSIELQHVQGRENALSVDSDRQARLRAVKERIANGSYAPDSKKVAVSLLKYIVEGNKNG